ncbi:MAG TPA: hypothetical protein PLO84_14150 [Thermotogota bacterium]|nr:hypothetical protein [Thermotogota bacterium]
MNYMELMNRFWLINLEANFTGTQAKLYFALLDIANRFYWEKEELSIPLIELCSKTNCSKRAVLDARKRLEEHGLIQVTKGFGNKRSAVIRIMDVPKDSKHTDSQGKTGQADSSGRSSAGTVVKQKAAIGEPTPKPEVIPNASPNTAPYKRQDKDKEKTRHYSSSPRFVKQKDGQSVELRQLKQEEEELCRTVLNGYQSICTSLHRVYRLTDERKRAIRKLNRYFSSPDEWERYFFKLSDTPFITDGTNGWKADFDWILEERNYIRVMEDRFYEKKKVAADRYVKQKRIVLDDNAMLMKQFGLGM